jgi:polyhydroxyalkanoate synthesis repressor PhaR
VRILKKYPNRRLYDTEKSCFVSLDAVRRLVLDGVDFQVLDSRTGEDLTRSVLLQIINEQEAHTGGSLLTDQVLRQLIRFYGDSLHLAMREYLERSIGLFLDQHRIFHEQVRSVMSGNPFQAMAKVAEQNLAMWQDLLSSARAGPPDGPPEPDPDTTATSASRKSDPG